LTERRPSAVAVPLHDRAARPRSLVASWALRVGTAAALAIDAAVHLQNASGYDAVKATVSQGALFRVEAGVAIAAALLVLVWPRRASWVVALLVAASALGAVLLYRYVDVGQLGPLPNMYENTWQVPGKLLSAWAEGAAVVLAGLGLLTHRGAPTRTSAGSRAPASAAKLDR
jgi:hypothetical protein